MESNQDSRSLSRSFKRVKRGTTDSKLVNLDIVRAKRAEIFNRQLYSFNFSDSEEEINPSPRKKRSTEIGVEEGKEAFDQMLTEEVYTESDCSNDENLTVRFNISLLDLFSKKQVANKEDSLFVAVSLSLFGNEMYTNDIREETRMYIQENKHRFSEYIQEDPIDLYLQKMNVEKKLGVNLELLAISEIFKVNIKVYFLLTQMDPYIEIETQSTEKTIHLYEESKEHFSLFVKKESKIEYSEYNEVTSYKIDQLEESKMEIKTIDFGGFMSEKETTLAKNYYSAVFQYLKFGKYPDKLLESFTGKAVRKFRKKNFRGEVKKEKKYRIGIQHWKGMKLEQLEKNWSFSAQKSQTKLLRSKCELQEQKNLVKSLILDQWSIYPKEHQAKEILFLAHTISGSHLSISRTWEKVKETGYRWENLEESARSLYFDWEICGARGVKPKKYIALKHINSSYPKERFQVDMVYLSDMLINSPDERYLLSIVDHFSKYGWVVVLPNKKSKTVLKAIRECLKITGKPTILHTDNGGEFNNELLKKFLEQNNIQYVRGSPYHPQSQGAVESFNRTIQNFLYLAKDMQGSEFDLNDSVYDFIMHYNNRIHTSTKFKPQEVFQNIMNEDMKKKVLENIIKSMKRGKSNSIRCGSDC